MIDASEHLKETIQATVYLIHFDTPYHHAKHYLGSAVDLEARIAAHRAGTGARLLEVVNDAGIGWHVVRVWTGAGRKFEAQLKRYRHAARLCPVCNPRASEFPHSHISLDLSTIQEIAYQ